MVVAVGVGLGTVGIWFVIIGHISDHFVVRVVGMMVRLVKQFEERVKSAKNYVSVWLKSYILE